MSEFCFQCNVLHMFHPSSDFDHYGKSGQLTPEDTARGFGIPALCEGCGPTMVDHRGYCMYDCAEHSSESHGKVLRSVERWVARRSGRLGRLYRFHDWFFGTPWWPGQWHNIKLLWHQRHKCKSCGKRFCNEFHLPAPEHYNCRCIIDPEIEYKIADNPQYLDGL